MENSRCQFQLIRGALRPSLVEGAPSLGERAGETDPVACRRDKAAGENETYHGLVDSACTLRPFRSNTSSKSVSQRSSVSGLLPRGSTRPRDDPTTDPPWDRLLFTDPAYLCLKSPSNERKPRSIPAPEKFFRSCWNFTCQIWFCFLLLPWSRNVYGISKWWTGRTL